MFIFPLVIKLFIAYCLFCKVIAFALAKFVSLYVQVHLCSGVFLPSLSLLSRKVELVGKKLFFRYAIFMHHRVTQGC